MNDRRTVLERKEEQIHKNKGILRCGGIPEREKTDRNGRNSGPKRAEKPATQEDAFRGALSFRVTKEAGSGPGRLAGSFTGEVAWSS